MTDRVLPMSYGVAVSKVSKELLLLAHAPPPLPSRARVPLSAWQLWDGDSPGNQARIQTTTGLSGAWVGALKRCLPSVLRGSTEMPEMAVIKKLNSGDRLPLEVQQGMERSQLFGVPTA